MTIRNTRHDLVRIHMLVVVVVLVQHLRTTRDRLLVSASDRASLSASTQALLDSNETLGRSSIDHHEIYKRILPDVRH
jgi:hypothetical protein